MATTSTVSLGGACAQLVCVSSKTYQHYRDGSSLDPTGTELPHDAEELSRAYEAMRASEQRLRSAAEYANDAIISADGTGNIVSWNKGAQAIFGYEEADALGKPLALVHPGAFPGRPRVWHQAHEHHR